MSIYNDEQIKRFDKKLINNVEGWRSIKKKDREILGNALLEITEMLVHVDPKEFVANADEESIIKVRSFLKMFHTYQITLSKSLIAITIDFLNMLIIEGEKDNEEA